MVSLEFLPVKLSTYIGYLAKHAGVFKYSLSKVVNYFNLLVYKQLVASPPP